MKHDEGDKKVSREELMRLLQKFAGNTAHDMNNVLTPIVGFGRMLAERLTDEGDLADVQELLNSADRGMTLCRRYGEMAHFNNAETLPGDLVQALRSAAAMFEQKLGADAAISWDLPDAAGALFDELQLFMVLDHIASNAATATKNNKDDCTFHVSLAESDGMLEVVCADNGPGFPDKVLRAFGLPFNTDKPAHKLSGSGLALCRSAVMEWGGTLNARNTASGGEVVMRLVPAELETEAGVDAAASAVEAGSAGSILLLETDEAEAERMTADLESAGYAVHRSLDSAADKSLDFGLIALGYPEEMECVLALNKHSPKAVLYRLAAGMTGSLFITKPTTKESLLAKLQGE